MNNGKMVNKLWTFKLCVFLGCFSYFLKIGYIGESVLTDNLFLIMLFN